MPVLQFTKMVLLQKTSTYTLGILDSSASILDSSIQIIQSKNPSIIRVSESPQKLRDIITQHLINCLDLLWFQLLEPVDVITFQNLPKVLHIREVTRGQVAIPLDLHLQWNWLKLRACSFQPNFIQNWSSFRFHIQILSRFIQILDITISEYEMKRKQN